MNMSYSTITHALVNYVESHLENFNLKEMAGSFGFSEIYLRELFYKNVHMPIMQYCKRRRMISSAFELLHSDKKILTIALENGFSNPESYTRAFRGIFGTTPSHFRSERPQIGRKQLEVGVFGLEQLERKTKRSDEIMIEQDKNNTILYGIPKIEQGAYGSNTMFPICVKAVSEYLGDDVSYAYIMAATGAAFRLVWNRAEWDLSNIDIYHTLRESNDIYQYGAKALGREFSFLEREKETSREEFSNYMKTAIAKGYPVIALGIIGPPEPCIIAGFESGGDVVMGWNFFQNDAEFSSAIVTMDNGYFRYNAWWENTDTQAVMCIGAIEEDTLYDDRDIVKMALNIMEAREENTYAKGIRAYEAWKDMLLQEKCFENSSTFDKLFSKLLVQNDAMTCLYDGRKWAAKYFEELAIRYQGSETFCVNIAGNFNKVSKIAGEMKSLIGDWNDTEKMLENFRNRLIRKRLGELIVEAGREDRQAYEQIKLLYSRM